MARVHVCGKATGEIKEVLRQRCFFVRQRTMMRNRIHRLLGAQHGLQLPQCSDLFGAKGMSFLDKLELPAPAWRPPDSFSASNWRCCGNWPCASGRMKWV
jgi:hypothetical protein